MVRSKCGNGRVIGEESMRVERRVDWGEEWNDMAQGLKEVERAWEKVAQGEGTVEMRMWRKGEGGPAIRRMGATWEEVRGEARGERFKWSEEGWGKD